MKRTHGISVSTLLNVLPDFLLADPPVRVVLEFPRLHQLLVLLPLLILVPFVRGSILELHDPAVGSLEQSVAERRVHAANHGWRVLPGLQGAALHF